jgi:hypothetical protein
MSNISSIDIQLKTNQTNQNKCYFNFNSLCSFSLLQLFRYSCYSESTLIAVKVDGTVTLEGGIHYITVANVYAGAPGLFIKSDVDANVTSIKINTTDTNLINMLY